MASEKPKETALIVTAQQEELLTRMQRMVGRPGEEAAEQMSYEGSSEFQKQSKEAFLAQVQKSKEAYPGSDVSFRTNGIAFVLRDGKVTKVVLDADHIKRRSSQAAESPR